MKIERILVPLDGSALAEQALAHATVLARATGASVSLLSIVPDVVLYDASGLSSMLSVEIQRSCDRMRAYLDGKVAELTAAGIAASGDVAIDAAAKAIVEAAAKQDADLIVLTSHGRGGFARFWLGSVADAVVRRAGTPVYVVRPAEDLRGGAYRQPRLASILVPLDGSPEAEQAVDPAVTLALALDASLTLFLAIESPLMISPELAPYSIRYDPVILFEQHQYATRYLERTANGIRARGVTVRTVSTDEGPVAKSITDHARENGVDLIVMGSHGRGGVRRFLIGSVADKVIRQADVPVLVARSEAALPPAQTDPHEAWQRELASFSQRNRERPVRIEVDTPVLGSQREVEGLDLISVDYDPRGDRFSVSVTGRGGAHLTHRIGHPTRLDILREAGGELLSVQHDGGQTLLRVDYDMDEIC